MGQGQSVPDRRFSRVREDLCLLSKPWRDIGWTSRNQLLGETRGFKTGSFWVPKLNLLLVGAVGSGKSSFCSTVDSILKGRISAREETMESFSATSITRKFSIMKPGGRRAGDVGFNVCDTMGMEQEDGLNLDDLAHVLDGHVQHGYEFSAERRFTPSMFSYPNSAKKMHCLAYVVDGTKVDLAPEEIRETFNRLQNLTRSRGVKIVILVTHIDKISIHVSSSVTNAHRSKSIKKIVDRITSLTNVPVSQIYLIKNYCTETETESDIDVLNLTALQRMMHFASLNVEQGDHDRRGFIIIVVIISVMTALLFRFVL